MTNKPNKSLALLQTFSTVRKKKRALISNPTQPPHHQPPPPPPAAALDAKESLSDMGMALFI